MSKQRQLRRLDFDLIQTEMSIIEGELLRGIVGGYQNDCFWRCIAFIDSNGSSYSESLAESYAQCYFGPKVNLNEREDGAGMTDDQMSRYISQNYSSSSQYGRQILQFDPNKVPNMVGGSMLHAVVFLSSSTDANGNKTYYVADPQKDKAYEIPAKAVTASFYLGSKIQSSGSGSSGSGSSSGYGSSGYGSSGSGSSSGYGSSGYGSSSGYYGSSYYG